MAKQHIAGYQLLVEQYRAGDESALVKILDRMVKLFDIAIRVYESRSTDSYEYKDLLQICRDKVWRIADTFDPARNPNFTTYAMTCVRNALKDQMRKDKTYAEKHIFIGDGVDGKTPWFDLKVTAWGYMESVDAVVVYNDFCNALRNRLTRDACKVLDLLIGGLSHRAAGRELGITSGVLRKHTDAIQKHARSLIKDGVEFA